MKKEELEKYISELSPELQEKAKNCKTEEELMKLAAENDLELSEDALQAVSGGCGYSRGDAVKGKFCPECGSSERQLYCNNTSCSRYINYYVDKSGYKHYTLWEDQGDHLHPLALVDTIKR